MVSLESYLPWASSPIIINAPMGGFAGGKLSSQVTLAGGLGFIGAVNDSSALESELAIASKVFQSDPRFQSSKTLPIGVGALPFVTKLDEILSVLQNSKPLVLWLFAAKELDDYVTWAEKVRAVSPDTKIWIQCGSVEAALHIAKTARPDAICLQGSDAGGHGFEKGAGIITLLPETVDAFAKNVLSNIPLLAAGGITDGRGVAAALALGASGAVLGTRFLASQEVIIHPKNQSAILEATDGGQSTTRSKLFDNLRGPNIWPEAYDGRSIVVKSYKEWKDGVNIEDIRKKHNEEAQTDSKGYATGREGRAAIWAGTGVGLVNEIESAGDIVRKVREEAKEVLGRLAKL